MPYKLINGKQQRGFATMAASKARKIQSRGGSSSRRGLASKTVEREIKQFQEGFNGPSWRDKIMRRFK